LLAVAVFLVLLALTFRRRTALGDDVLADLQQLFAGLNARAALLPADGSSNEMAFVAAVFGIAAATVNPRVAALKDLFPKASSSSSSSSGCGSSCGSSGCGSSCGGGGCGGGCGGCGS
jgi:hypothetical protein